MVESESHPGGGTGDRGKWSECRMHRGVASRDARQSNTLLQVEREWKVTIQTDDSTFAGDIIQSLAMYLGVRELNSEATFPAEETRMLDALERVKGTRGGRG